MPTPPQISKLKLPFLPGLKFAVHKLGPKAELPGGRAPRGVAPSSGILGSGHRLGSPLGPGGLVEGGRRNGAWWALRGLKTSPKKMNQKNLSI